MSQSADTADANADADKDVDVVLDSLHFSCPPTIATEQCKLNLIVVLEECNPVVLILVLTLVSVGRPSAGACGSKKLVLLAFLLSICHI